MNFALIFTLSDIRG